MSILSGMNVRNPSLSDIDAVVDLRMRWIRISIDWSQIESCRGEPDWTRLDQIISYSKNNGLRVYGTLSKTPSWDGQFVNYVPQVEAWVDFVKAVSRRYGSNIDVYSLWNKPNVDFFWDGSLTEYVNVVFLPASAVLSKLGLTIAVPELSMHESNWPMWLDAMIDNSSSYDILSLHVFGDDVGDINQKFSGGRYGLLNLFKKSWKPYNRWIDKISKPIWLTEVGFRSDKFGKDRQALNYLGLVTKGVCANVVMSYELKDRLDSVEKWGVLYANGDEKPAAMIIKNA